MKRRTLAMAGALVALAPAPLLAHPFHLGEGLAAGLLHPLGGADHLLALVAVGLLASRYDGRRALCIPAAFVVGTAGGFLAGLGAVGTPLLEAGLLTTVLGTGALVAAPRLTIAWIAAAGIGLFGTLHGVAHATEVGAAGLAAGAGLVTTTSLLHGAGMIAGTGLRRAHRTGWTRALGATVVAAGAALPFLA
jgi:urease accessory protein